MSRSTTWWPLFFFGQFDKESDFDKNQITLECDLLDLFCSLS